MHAVGAHPPHEHRADEREDRWLDLLREGRWVCLSWTQEYGGRALGELECLAVGEEFARAGVRRPHLGMGESLVAPVLLARGTEEQKRRFLPRILSGEDGYSRGVSEPGAGSDLASLRTTGVVDGDELVVHGHKIWTSGATEANMMFLLCRTDPDAERHRALTYELVPMSGHGIGVRPIRQMAGGAGYCEEFIDGARAPLSNVIRRSRQRPARRDDHARRRASGRDHRAVPGYRAEFDHLVARLRDLGRLADPLVRDELARLLIRVELMRYTGRRVAVELHAGTRSGSCWRSTRSTGRSCTATSLPPRCPCGGSAAWSTRAAATGATSSSAPSWEPRAPDRPRHQPYPAQHHRRARPRPAEVVTRRTAPRLGAAVSGVGWSR